MTTLRPFLIAQFIAAPISVLPVLDTSARLDLIDYFEAGMTAKVENRYAGTSELTALSDTLVALHITEATSLEMCLTPDSNIVVKRTYTLPEGDVVCEKLYDKEWKRIR